MFDYAAYAQKLREEIHMYPEIGYDLPRTLAVVHRELDAMGLTYTDKYCRSSVVSVINDEKKGFTIGLRADMDALPIQEEVDVPFKSRIDGQMHACGHDFHTAVLLAVAKYLVDHKEQLRCRVKLLFTPAEEYEDPGCKHMAENGVMDDVDCAVAIHVNSKAKVGEVQINDAGGTNGNSMGFKVDFYGKSAHAAAQYRGKDAILMAVDAITAMEFMVAKEVDGRKCKVLNIGSIHGGKTNNVICDHVSMFGTLRTWDDDVNDYITARLQQICENVATTCGGRADFRVVKFMPYNRNHPVMVEKLRASTAKIFGEKSIVQKPRTLGGEDFAFFSRIKPTVQFKVGVEPADATEQIAGHNGKFRIDNGGFPIAIKVFTQFVFDNMDGIEFTE